MWARAVQHCEDLQEPPPWPKGLSRAREVRSSSQQKARGDAGREDAKEAGEPLCLATCYPAVVKKAVTKICHPLSMKKSTKI